MLREALIVTVAVAAPAPARETPEQRAAALVARMTLEEKAAQLRADAPAVPRLGIPAYHWWSEGLHGVARAGVATVFPQAIGLAATWDAALVERVAAATAVEFRAKYRAARQPDGGSARYQGLTVWSPNINIYRDPRWGRGQETYGEDPYLTGRLAVAFVRGLQGPDLAHPRTLAVVKHFAVHSGPEANRHRENVHPTAHDLEDTYLPAFRAAVTEARPGGVMCAYNAVDGVPACASPLLAQRLRGDWRFGGHVVSDCAAVADIFLPGAHHYVATPEAAVAAALNAGTDLICGEFGPDKSADPAIVVRAVRQGLVGETVIDRAVTRLLADRVRLGLIGGASPAAAIPVEAVDTPAHRELATEAARASLVLLKNDGLLPLRRAPARIAVIGPNGDAVEALLGNYHGTPAAPVTVVAGLRARFPAARVTQVLGSGLTAPDASGDAAAAAARDAELVVFVGGLSPRLEGEEMRVAAPGFAGGDRTSLDLPAAQQALLERLHGTGTPVVLVLMNGGALSIGWADRHLPAIVEAWYPGGEGGRAVAALIAGDYSPSGRLPVTFYRGVGDLPAFDDYRMAGRTYRYFAGAPLYPFGHGLSYTRFAYARATVSRRQVSAGATVRVAGTVTNTGARDGAEVVQLYLTHHVAGAPRRQLAGIRRVVLRRGETRRVAFFLDVRALSLVDAQGRRTVRPGRVDLWIGGGQPGTAPGAAAVVTIRGARAVAR